MFALYYELSSNYSSAKNFAGDCHRFPKKESHGQVSDFLSERGDGCARWRVGDGRPRRSRGDR